VALSATMPAPAGAGAIAPAAGLGPGTLCGAAFATEPGETYQEALVREDAIFGGLESVRIFYPGMPRPWPGRPDAGDRPVIVSFKAPPAEVLAGTHDADLRAWFAGAPAGVDVYWAYFHEPEDDIKEGAFTAAEFRQAWQRIAGLADEAANPSLRATLILMGWSVDPASGRNWRDYYPGREHVDVLGWDLYNPSWESGRYRAPAELFAGVIEASRAEGLPFGIAETGSPLVTGDDGAGRAAWLRDLIAHLSSAGAAFVAYFDLDWTARNGADYRLRDPAGIAAWTAFCD
jgi:hypothetical protein